MPFYLELAGLLGFREDLEGLGFGALGELWGLVSGTSVLGCLRFRGMSREFRV